MGVWRVGCQLQCVLRRFIVAQNYEDRHHAALRISRDGVRDVTPSECLSPALIWWASVGCARIAASNALTHSELFQQALLVRLFSLRSDHCAIGTIRIRLFGVSSRFPFNSCRINLHCPTLAVGAFFFSGGHDRALLEPITLDFDPMSFEFKEDSPLTSPSDSNREIGEMLSPSQNVDVVEFFDPFCPVKEESPTDYYPNVMLGQTTLGEPLLEGLSEPQQFSTIDEPLLDNLSEPQQFSTSDEPLIDNLSEPQQFSNGFSNYEDQDDTNLLGSYQEEIPEITTDVIEDEDIPDHLEEEIPNEPLSDICTNSDLTTLASSKSETSADVELLTELEQIHSEETCISPVSEQVFDDSKHDISSQHEQSQIFEDDCEIVFNFVYVISDEAHFWLNGYVNKQNCRIWSEANPQVYVETPLHPEKLTVWCALWAGGILLQKR
ncbi:uncharacterized protein TNCV_4793451 [Trichonephila clavipes]|nr:uncharacterized protein TNCV_4793451 [Trichonephila clavipes]